MMSRMTKNRKRIAIDLQDSPRPGRSGYHLSRCGGLFCFMAVGGGHCGSCAWRFLPLFILVIPFCFYRQAKPADVSSAPHQGYNNMQKRIKGIRGYLLPSQVKDDDKDEETHKQRGPLQGALDNPADWRFKNWLNVSISASWMRPLRILRFAACFPLFHAGYSFLPSSASRLYTHTTSSSITRQRPPAQGALSRLCSRTPKIIMSRMTKNRIRRAIDLQVPRPLTSNLALWLIGGIWHFCFCLCADFVSPHYRRGSQTVIALTPRLFQA